MPEATPMVPRRLALGELREERASRATPDDVVIRLLAPRARFALRIDPSLLSKAKDVAGFTLALPINRSLRSPERAAMRLGPDEWLLLGPDSEATRIALDVRASLAGLHHALVDVSHRHIALSVSGPRATDVLNSGCALDLYSTAFPDDYATRTLLGKSEVILSKTDEAPTFEIECGRSFAAYVHNFLLEAAREFRVHPSAHARRRSGYA
jgi:sarcosine oxidase subunit gamma